MAEGTGRIEPDPRWPPGSLLSALTPAQQEELARLGSQRTVGRGEIVIHEGDRDRTVYLLLRGAVKVTSVSASGSAILLAVRLAGDLVGELAALDDLPRSATVVTATRVTYRSIVWADFVALMARDPAVDRAVHRAIAGKLRQATRMRSEVNSASPLIRVARVLVHLGDRYGRPTAQGTLLDIHLTQAELAALVGVGEASVERAFRELRGRGLVQTSYRQVMLRDLTRLAAVAAAE